MKLFRSLSLLAILFFTACATPRPITMNFGAQALIAIGVVQWQVDKDATPMRGDLVLRYHRQTDATPEQLVATVSKGPALTFLELQMQRWVYFAPSGAPQTDRQWFFHIIPENRKLGGRDARVPKQLEIWTQLWICASELDRPSGSSPARIVRASGPRRYETTMSEYSLLGSRNVPTRFIITESITGARLELKINEIR